MSSKVYFTDFRVRFGDTLPKKLQRLMKQAGFEEIDFKDKFVAIKIHFGELGNLAYLRPNYARAVADYVKERGGRPFLTDCNTLYVGSRKDGLVHMETAYLNGFTPYTTGCHVIIADGIKGTNETLVPIDCEYVKEARIGSAIMDADIVISLSHVKGHEQAGFGGALKNLGMGSGSRAGKMQQHCDGKPVVDPSRCIGCGACARICAHDGPQIKNGKCTIDMDKCVGCGRCIGVCARDAIEPAWDGTAHGLNCRIAEYAYAVCKDRPNFHIALICDVSPNCDCHSENDVPIIPDVGMLASFDPVALDCAAADLCLAQPVNRGSVLEECISNGAEGDHFHAVHPNTYWQYCVEHGEKIGLGSREYELIKL